jgi:hypothetical protein
LYQELIRLALVLIPTFAVAEPVHFLK